jgi:BirA family biotin operon repressor/biotin-[acetyl-CoA-carboxylase] ligase
MAFEDLRRALEGLPPGWHGLLFESVGSTQDEARRAAAQGASTRSVLVADYQSAGRGRQGRVWHAPPGAALLVSILLRETGDVPRLWRTTALAAVALVEAIEAAAPSLQPAIKWPNDLMLDGRKVAGILAESWSERNQLAIAIGIGVNVNTRAEDLQAVSSVATSLRVASGADVDRGALLLALVEGIDRWQARPESELQATWQARLWGRGQRLRLADIGLDEEVVVLGATLDGALRVRLPDGTERTTTTGELLL